MPNQSSTLIPDPPNFPLLLPEIPRPYPTPLPKRDPSSLAQKHIKWTDRHNWAREIEELSDEEAEFDEILNDVQNRGFAFLVPIGRTLTQQEEKSDAQGESHSSEDSSHSDDEGENDLDNDGDADGEEDEDGDADLDADMEDLDQEEGEDEGGDEELGEFEI